MGEENADEAIGRDLWGNPVYRLARVRGRPRFERTDENANKVSMLLAMGWENVRIASVIRDPRTGKPISVPTLKRHFRSELRLREVARDQLAARQLMQAWAKAEDGNVGAMKHFDKLVDKNDLALAEAKLRSRDDRPPEPKAMPVGKKEIDAAVAKEAEAEIRAQIEREAGRARTKH